MVQYYLQLKQPSGRRSCWIGGYASKTMAKKVANNFREKDWSVHITLKPTKWNKKGTCRKR
jgi:hypothetical protein